MLNRSRWALFVCLFGSAMVCGCALYSQSDSSSPSDGAGARDPHVVPTIAQYFSPEEDLESIWVEHINAARESIHIACFGLSNRRIGDALAAAIRRGVRIVILEDQREAKQSGDLHGPLASAGCKIVIKRSKVLLHDKMGVFDGISAIVGSYNLSESAEEQDNSMVVLDNDPGDVQRDEAAWAAMFRREIGKTYSDTLYLQPVTPGEPG